jgi:hypothetical protein
LRPRATPLQAVHDSSVTLSPGARHPCGALRIISKIRAKVLHRSAAHPSGSAGGKPGHGATGARARLTRQHKWEEVRLRLESPQDEEERDAVQYLFDSPMTKYDGDIADYGALSFPPSRPCWRVRWS